MPNVIGVGTPAASATRLRYTHEIIFITPSQVYECLHKHEQVLRARMGLVTCLAIALTSGSTVLTAKEYNTYGFDSATWRAVFILITLVAGGAALVYLVKVLAGLKRGSLDATVAEIKSRGSVVSAESSAVCTTPIDL